MDGWMGEQTLFLKCTQSRVLWGKGEGGCRDKGEGNVLIEALNWMKLNCVWIAKKLNRRRVGKLYWIVLNLCWLSLFSVVLKHLKLQLPRLSVTFYCKLFRNHHHLSSKKKPFKKFAVLFFFSFFGSERVARNFFRIAAARNENQTAYHNLAGSWQALLQWRPGCV